MAGEATISDGAVKKATGKVWKQWFAQLDRWGARARSHQDIARYLHGRKGLSGWWSQTVTVRYEQERGLRDVGQRSDRTYTVGVQRTIRTSLKDAWAAFTDAQHLGRWYTTRARVDLRVGGRYSNADKDRGEFLRVEPRRRLRFTWDNPQQAPGTIVDVQFARNNSRVTVRLEHSRLCSPRDREDLKEGWTGVMDELKTYLEET